MTKEQVMNDMNFRTKCGSYGLYWEDFNIIHDIIVVSAPKKGIYVLFDNNYNTIGIHRMDANDKSLEEIVDGYSELYEYVDEDTGHNFPYPFKSLSLKQIVELADKIFIHSSNHGNSFNMVIDGKIIDCSSDSTYVELLSYIKFIGEQIKTYFHNFYQMMVMGYDYLDIYSYVRRIMDNIDECIRVNRERDINVRPIDILDYLGQERNRLDRYEHLLDQVIELYSKEDDKDLSILSDNLVKLLDEISLSEVGTTDLKSLLEQSGSAIKLTK